MPRTTPTLFPSATRQLASLGERLRVARLRRRYSADSVAKRAGIARGTLYRVEEGDAGVSLATYAPRRASASGKISAADASNPAPSAPSSP
jgi:DNA-binding XRE family transcriptional regulator